MEKLLREQLYFLEDPNMSVNLKILNITGMEILLGLMVINILVNGEKEKIMEMEQKYGTMEESIQVILKMINYTV